MGGGPRDLVMGRYLPHRPKHITSLRKGFELRTIPGKNKKKSHLRICGDRPPLKATKTKLQ